MTAVVSLRPDADRPDAVAVIDAAAALLGVAPVKASDGTLELSFDRSYARAHTAVVQALGEVRADWPALVTLEYALAA
jgi:hypothetical protein